MWAAATLLLLAHSARAQGPPWDSLGRVLGAPPTPITGAIRYNLPRADLTVRVGDVVVAPALALVSWVGFGVVGPDTVVMGDLVVTAKELPGVLAQLEADRIAVTAVHNHLVGETPQVTYVHYEGRGSARVLAEGMARVLARTGVPRPVRPAASAPVSIDTARVFRELGTRGRANGAVVQLGFVLVPDTVRLRGHAVPAALAYGTPVNLQAVSPSRAVATGDFAITAANVGAVLDALARGGITATAVHSHLVGEIPRLYYIHFWGDGPLADVVRGLRAALDAAR
jgi:hypothetical protein